MRFPTEPEIPKIFSVTSDGISLYGTPHLDFFDIVLLNKFYQNHLEKIFPLLYKELKEKDKIKITSEAVRKRLDILVDLGFLKKGKRSNPAMYFPISRKEKIVKELIKVFDRKIRENLYGS